MKQDMDNWKIVSQIASGFVIVFVVFAILAALINFEVNSYYYESSAPAGYIQFSALASMLVYLLFAVLSFVVAWIVRRSEKEVSKEMPSVMSEPQHETQTEETEP